jgi:hypothetical protein
MVLLLEQVMVPLGPKKQKMCSSLVRFAARHTLRSIGVRVQVEFLEVSIQLADDGMMPEPEFGEPDDSVQRAIMLSTRLMRGPARPSG